MSTILFEPIGGGAPTTEIPDAIGTGTLHLFASGLAADLMALGAIGSGTLAFYQSSGGGDRGPDMEPGDDPDIDPPTYGIGAGTLYLLSGESVGVGVSEPAIGDGTLYLIGGFASGASGYGVVGAIGDAALSLYGYATAPYVPGALDPPNENDPMFPGGEYYGVVALSDPLAFSDGMSALHTVLLRARIDLHSAQRAEFSGTVSLRDSLALEDTLAAIYHLLFGDSLSLADTLTPDYTMLVQLFDALLLGEVVTTTLEAKALLVEAIAFGTLLDSALILTLADQMAFDDAVKQSYEGAAKLVDALLLSGTQTAGVTFAVLMQDDMTVGASQSIAADLLTALRDGLSFVSRLTANNDTYAAWVMNTTTKGMTTFSNYPFNSFMTVGGKTYGVSETGLYRLGGETDNGDDIKANVRLGMSNLGTRRLKRIPEAYVGFKANGDMQLKVIYASPTDGEREGHVYTMKPRDASMEPGRVKIGRGLKAVYFDFEIANVEGSDFSIDVIEIHVLPLDRSIRGNAGA